MQNKNKFSIIIPSYNSEKYIRNNLNSLVKAKIEKQDLQVLVIDDGSTNNITKKICDEYIKNKLINITYIKKKNGNWGSVINYVKNNRLITGDIVSILDSDDFYDLNVFEYVDKNINDVDAVIGNFKYFNGTKKEQKVFTYLSIFTHTIKNKYKKISPYCLPLPCFIKKDIFYQLNDLNENMSYQDGDLNTQIVNLSKKIKYVNKIFGFYYYNRADNSMSQIWDKNKINALITVCEKCIDNNAQEHVVYKIFANKKFRKELIKINHMFEVKRKFYFTWFPWFVRIFFVILYQIKFKNFFKFNYKK